MASLLEIHSVQTCAPSGRTVSETKVSGGHCEQFEQKCQVSLQLAFRYSEEISRNDEWSAACRIVPVDDPGYIESSAS